MRREKKKFSNLIKCIAQVYQLQRESFTHNGVRHVIASEDDFALAKRITEKFLMSTILILDDMELKILNWAREERLNENFTVKDASKACLIPYKTTYRRVKELSKNGYIDEIMEPFGQRAAAYELTELGSMKQLVDIRIYDHGEKLVKLYRKLPGSEGDLRLLLDKRRREEPYLDAEESEAPAIASNKRREKGLVSKKQLDLKDVFQEES